MDEEKINETQESEMPKHIIGNDIYDNPKPKITIEVINNG